MPEKTIHGYNYKVKIWYPNAPENKTEGNILAAYDEDLAKQIQLQYPGVTYEIISKEPVLGDPQLETIPVKATGWDHGPKCVCHVCRIRRQPQENPGVTSYKMTWGICARCGLRPALYMPLRFCEECHREFSQIGGEPGSEDRRRRYEEFMARGKSGNPGDPGGKPSRLDVIRRIKPILPLTQLNMSGGLLRGEEGDHFLDLFDRLAKTFETMPKPYQTEGTPTDDKIVHLHYFTSASDWYIVERDSSQEQLQAFGYVILNQDLQNAEWGYVSIEELKGIPQVELDFYWTPKAFKEVMTEKNPGAPGGTDNLRDRLIAEIYDNRMNAWKQGHAGVKPVSDDDLTELRSMTTQELEQTAKLTRQFLIPVVAQTQETKRKWSSSQVWAACKHAGVPSDERSTIVQHYKETGELPFETWPSLHVITWWPEQPDIPSEERPEWPEPIPEYVKMDPELLGNAIMHIAQTEGTKIGATSGGDLRHRGLLSEYESNFITALQKAEVPKPLPPEIEERLVSENFHTANEILTKYGYYPWRTTYKLWESPGSPGADDKRQQRG